MVTLPDWAADATPRRSIAAPLTSGTGTPYGEKALAGLCGDVAAAINGTRNDTLNRAAFRAAQLTAGGEIDGHAAWQGLADAARACGLAEGEIAKTLNSAFGAGQADPRAAPDRNGSHAASAEALNPQQPLKRKSRFFSAAEWQGKPVPAREWLCEGLIPMRNVTLLGGDGGTGKSLLALQLGVAVASGGMWIGKPVRNGGVIFLSAEDDEDELQRRTFDILDHVQRRFEDLEALTVRSVAGEDALLAIEGQLKLLKSELFNELESRAGDEAPALIVIDTLADVYPANENDRAKVRQFVGILRSLAIKRDCAVMLLGHPSLTGLNSGSGTSGSTAWNNSVRSRLYFKRIMDGDYEPDVDQRILESMKSNYGRKGEETLLRWQRGVFTVHSGSASGSDAMMLLAKAERVFLSILDDMTRQGRYVSSSPCPTYAPGQFASHPKAEGCTKRALKAAMDALFDRGLIVNVTHGKGAKARTHIALAGGDHADE
jgi:RecA-family ATPase